MSDLFRRISKTFLKMRGQKARDPEERRGAPRFICSVPVVWEAGRHQGEAELRELSSTGMKIWTQSAILAGKHIRVRPLDSLDAAPLTLDVAIGTVVYSRSRGGGFEVGVDLVHPEKISRFAWMGQLTSTPSVPSPLLTVLPQANGPKLSLVSNDRAMASLLRPEFALGKEEKFSKNKDTK